MRFMMLSKVDAKAEAGLLPDEKEFAAMGKYNADLIRGASCSKLRG